MTDTKVVVEAAVAEVAEVNLFLAEVVAEVVLAEVNLFLAEVTVAEVVDALEVSWSLRRK